MIMINDTDSVYWVFNIVSLLMVGVLPILIAYCLALWEKRRQRKALKEEDYYVYSGSDS